MSRPSGRGDSAIWASQAEIAGLVGAPKGNFLLIDLNRVDAASHDLITLVRRHAREAVLPIPRRWARELGGLMMAGPEVAEPGTRLATVQEYQAFAVANRGSQTADSAGYVATRIWNALSGAANSVRSARSWVPLFPLIEHSPGEIIDIDGRVYERAALQTIAALPLRFAVTADAGPEELANPPVDVVSLYDTLGIMGGPDYKAPGFRNLGARSLDSLAGFASHLLPDRPPLPTRG